MDAVEILVFMAVMGLLFYQKATRNQSKDKKPRQKRPVVALEEEKSMSETVISVEKPVMSKHTPFYEADLKRKSMRPVPEPPKKNPAIVSSAAGTSEETVRFRNLEDVRRAFLYSEIFNRKYD